jgi:hypothetical protein
LERRPERLLRVGERPARAETGDDLAAVLSLVIGDFGCKVRRGVEEGLTGLDRDSGMAVVEVVLRTKLEGFRPLAGDEKREPLERLEKLTGSTFSKLLMSSKSALRLPLVGGDIARQIVSIMRATYEVVYRE